MNISVRSVMECSRCLLDEFTPGISFDSRGLCTYCIQTEEICEAFGTGQEKGQRKLKSLISDIKRSGRRNSHDCIVGVSGGTDSSYLLAWAVQNGLRPLAVHYDNTWNTAIASSNIKRMIDGLGLDLVTHIVDNKEVDDIFKSFLKAGVAELDSSTDLGFAYLLREVARRRKIGYILEGHSFMEEGISPLSRNYFDGKYISSIHKEYGTTRIKTYPLMTFSKFLYSALVVRPKFIRPFWYMAYSKSQAKAFLKKNFGWQDYGGHHMENHITTFLHTYYLPLKFNTDLRINFLCAQIRNLSITKAQAKRILEKIDYVENESVCYLCKRLDLSKDELASIMESEPRSWKEFSTYKDRFRLLRPMFFLLTKMELVPRSFYLKYCF